MNKIFLSLVVGICMHNVVTAETYIKNNTNQAYSGQLGYGSCGLDSFKVDKGQSVKVLTQRPDKTGKVTCGIKDVTIFKAGESFNQGQRFNNPSPIANSKDIQINNKSTDYAATIVRGGIRNKGEALYRVFNDNPNATINVVAHYKNPCSVEKFSVSPGSYKEVQSKSCAFTSLEVGDSATALKTIWNTTNAPLSNESLNFRISNANAGKAFVEFK